MITVVIEIVILCFFFYKCNVAIDNNPQRKRFYKVMTGIVYMVTSLASTVLLVVFDEKIFLYTCASFLIAIGYWLSAMNPNLRDIFAQWLFAGIFLFVAYSIRYEHKVIAIILAIWMGSFMINVMVEGIKNMIHGIDPDIPEKKKGISSFTLLKWAFKIWRFW